MTCDLHVHSHYSDGSLSPSQIIAQAKQQNLVVALTDHNTVAGLPEFTAQAQSQGVMAVPGIELSTDHQGVELHLLGLFIKPEYYDVLEQLTEKFRAKKERSNQELVLRLQKAGYAIDDQTIKAGNPYGVINRAHIAVALLAKGYVASIREAFERLLKPEHGFYCPPERLSLMDAIRTLSNLGILPVLAHPLKDMGEIQLRDVLPKAIQAGLVGMETYHSSYDESTKALAAQIAQTYQLLPSGGSDFHGSNKPGIDLDCCRVPVQVYERLLQHQK